MGLHTKKPRSTTIKPWRLIVGGPVCLWVVFQCAFKERQHYQKVTTTVLPDSAAALRRMAAKLQQPVTPSCPLKGFGSEWGKHVLCDYPPSRKDSCVFYSFGISHDYSFDTDLAKRWRCRGFAADPTVIHLSQLHPRVTFHNVAAKTRAASPFPVVTSMPSLMKWLNHTHVSVLKMDCDGCEYSLGEDIATEDPSFFRKVDQFAVEVHLSKTWLDDPEALHSLGLLYGFLEEAGLELQHVDITPCAPEDEAPGCMSELLEMGYPCGDSRCCHNYLFSRPIVSTSD